MPITPEILKSIKKDYSVFIETGTFHGSGVDAARQAKFKKIHSIEFYKLRYEECVKKFNRYPNIKLLNCTISVGLEKILSELTEPAVFWLDAHYDASGVEEEIPVPLADTFPLLAELDVIGSHSIKTHTILIDDRRIFNGTHAVWHHVYEADVIAKLMEINPNYKIDFIDSSHFEKDIIVARL